MAIRRLTISPLASFLLALCAGITACMSVPPVQAAKADFNGAWSVKWCDKTNPNLECGGFNITLVQEGERVCGDFGGALVNLRQTDEGSIVGTAVGDTAVFAVESNRNGSIALVRAELKGSSLHWREVDSIKRGGTDIAIIATNEVLAKTHNVASHHKGLAGDKRSCSSILGTQGG